MRVVAETAGLDSQFQVAFKSKFFSIANPQKPNYWQHTAGFLAFPTEYHVNPIPLKGQLIRLRFRVWAWPIFIDESPIWADFFDESEGFSGRWK